MMCGVCGGSNDYDSVHVYLLYSAKFLQVFNKFSKQFLQFFIDTRHSFHALTARAQMDNILRLSCRIRKELFPRRCTYF